MKIEGLIYKEAFKWLLLIIAFFALGRITSGASMLVFALVGCCAAFTRRSSTALALFVLFPFAVIFNPILLPKSGALMPMVLRIAPLLIGLCLALSGCRRDGGYRLPFGSLFVYLLFAAISSYDGYVPMVSYFKLVNFMIFLSGIWFGTQNLDRNPQELFRFRAFIFALIAFLVIGSLIVYPMKGISTLGGLAAIAMSEGSMTAEMANELIRNQEGRDLFCGLTNQSQALSGLLSCCFGWIVCDMLFCEMKVRWQHAALIALIPIIIFMTRSRMGLVALLSFVAIFYGYTMKQLMIESRIKMRIKRIAVIGLSVAVIGLAVLEVASGTVSRWARKTDDLSGDQRSLSEAMTESRMGIVEKNLHDFRRNPLLGSGFQVDITHLDSLKGKTGLILSAPIEKGLLPLMVLGETGVVGGIVFLMFLISFCTICARKQMYATLTLFWVLFATNIGEATFFSPGGPGGIEWMIAIAGGFVVDATRRVNDQILRRWNWR